MIDWNGSDDTILVCTGNDPMMRSEINEEDWHTRSLESIQRASREHLT